MQAFFAGAKFGVRSSLHCAVAHAMVFSSSECEYGSTVCCSGLAARAWLFSIRFPMGASGVAHSTAFSPWTCLARAMITDGVQPRNTMALLAVRTPFLQGRARQHCTHLRCLQFSAESWGRDYPAPVRSWPVSPRNAALAMYFARGLPLPPARTPRRTRLGGMPLQGQSLEVGLGSTTATRIHTTTYDIPHTTYNIRHTPFRIFGAGGHLSRCFRVRARCVCLFPAS